MKIKTCMWPKLLGACFICYNLIAPAQVPNEKAPPALVEQAPATGTFFLMGRIPSPPFPFDPYHGALAVYTYDGVFFVDDSAVSFMEMGFASGGLFSGEEGGGMMLMSGPAPGGGGGGTNSATNLFCSSLTNFVVSYQYSANGLSLGIAQTTNTFVVLTVFTTNTSLLYDLYGTTNMNALALPQLGRTNWTWLLQATNAALSFNWGETNWCERYFQLGTLQDTDGDGLTDAYEHLVSHTNPAVADTDGDGLSDGWEAQNGLNPLLDDSGQSASRLNYTYDGAGRLQQVSGVQGKIVGIDAEGNILQLTQ